MRAIFTIKSLVQPLPPFAVWNAPADVGKIRGSRETSGVSFDGRPPQGQDVPQVMLATFVTNPAVWPCGCGAVLWNAPGVVGKLVEEVVPTT